MIKGFDVIFISYNEDEADQNYLHLQNIYPQAKRVHQVKGIRQAHEAAAQLSSTEFFFTIDADNRLQDGHEFNIPSQLDDNTVYVWRCLNPVNDLVYGYGAVKLWPKKIFLQPHTAHGDHAMNATKNYAIVPDIVSATHFNTSPFQAWLGGFRESVKLRHNIENNVDQQSHARLMAWQSQGLNKEYGYDTIRGALAGDSFYQGQQSLTDINDYELLAKIYHQQKEDSLFTLTQQLFQGLELIYPQEEIIKRSRFFLDKAKHVVSGSTEHALLWDFIKVMTNINEKKDIEEFKVLRQAYSHYFHYKRTQQFFALIYKTTGIELFDRIMMVIDRYPHSRIGEVFSKGQVQSKLWAIEELTKLKGIKPSSISIMAGWYGMMAELLWQKYPHCPEDLTSYDIDKQCSHIGRLLTYNSKRPQQICYRQQDIYTINSYSPDSLVINTSCEHLDNFNSWYAQIPSGQLLLLQSNDFHSCEEHSNCHDSIDHFASSVSMTHILYQGELQLSQYKRFMLIGRK